MTTEQRDYIRRLSEGFVKRFKWARLHFIFQNRIPSRQKKTNPGKREASFTGLVSTYFPIFYWVMFAASPIFFIKLVAQPGVYIFILSKQFPRTGHNQ
jgi:hypothetical protein